MTDKNNKTLRRKIFDIIQIGNKGDFLSRSFDWFIVIVIISNILVAFLDTFDELAWLSGVFRIVDAVTVFVFCVEYALRIWTAEYLYPELDRRKAVLRFFVSFDGIIDLLTILPFFFLYGFAAFRMLRHSWDRNHITS